MVVAIAVTIRKLFLQQVEQFHYWTDYSMVANLSDFVLCGLGNFTLEVHIKLKYSYLPTAGDMERDPDDPVGDGVGRATEREFGVPG